MACWVSQKIYQKSKDHGSSYKTDYHTWQGYTVDTEFIYARVIGIMASSRETISIATLFSHELAPHPTALFDDSGEMRKTSKSVLKTKLQVLCGMRNRQLPKVVILDACALLWTVPWPALPAKVSAFVNAAVSSIMERVGTT